MITLARHVYQAGSRVGAVHVGCTIRPQPRITISRTANPAIIHHDPSHEEPGAACSVVVSTWPFAVRVTAMGLGSSIPAQVRIRGLDGAGTRKG